MERGSISLTKLSERICAVEYNCQNLLKSYDMSKNKTLSLLNKLESSVRTLEQNTGQEIQTLKKAVVKRFEKIKEYIEIDEQEKEQGQNLARPLDDLYRVSTAYPVISSERPSGTKYPKVVKEYAWEPIHMSNLKEIKLTIIFYVLHSPFLREMVKIWASSSKATPHNWHQLILAVLEDGPQLLWKGY